MQCSLFVVILVVEFLVFMDRVDMSTGCHKGREEQTYSQYSKTAREK